MSVATKDAMSTIRLSVKGELVDTAADRSTLGEVERRLLERLDGAPCCAEFPRQPCVCLYETGPGISRVSVTDCCCDDHARVILATAEAELLA